MNVLVQTHVPVSPPARIPRFIMASRTPHDHLAQALHQATPGPLRISLEPPPVNNVHSILIHDQPLDHMPSEPREVPAMHRREASRLRRPTVRTLSASPPLDCEEEQRGDDQRAGRSGRHRLDDRLA